MTRRVAITVLALAAAAVAASPASAHHGARRRPRRRRSWHAPSCPPTRPRPPPFPASSTPTPRRRPAPCSRSAGSRRCSTRPAATTTGPCPTTASAPRPTRTACCCASTRSTPTSRRPTAGPGTVRILKWITLRDPDHKIPFKLVNDATPDRLLTGGDFDIESVREDYRGHAVVRRGVRALPPAHRRDGQGARGADPAARRQVARLPGRLPRAGRGPGEPQQLGRLRGHGASRPTAARCTRRSRVPSPATIRSRGACTSSTSAAAATRPSGAPTTSTTPELVGLRPLRARRPPLRRAGARRHHGRQHRPQAGLRDRPAQGRTPAAPWPSARSSTSSTCATRR